MAKGAHRIKAYYDAFNEWSRLDTPSGQIEFQRTWEILKSYLKPESRILDLGGGPGRYAIELAKASHRVWLADLSERLLEETRQKVVEYEVEKGIESIDLADATDLSIYKSGFFDVVLALGPFYHLISAADRKKAATEILRVLSPKGLVVVAFIPLLSGLAGLVARAAYNPDQVSEQALSEVFQNGVFHNRSRTGFQEGFYIWPSQIRDLFASLGATTERIVSLRSFAFCQEENLLKIREQDPELYSRFMELIVSTADNPGAIELGGHALYIGRKG